MKKKIAVCANGWNYDSLRDALEGIREYAEMEDFDVFVFLSFASYSEHLTLMQGELNIYGMMKPEDYDGVIVFSTALNSVETAVSLCRSALERHVPVVSIGMEIEGVHSVCVSNAEGMRELVEHLVNVHHIKRPFFVGGTPDHVDSMARLEVTRQVLAEHGIPFTDEDYGYGRWSNKYTIDLVDSILDSDREIPDAFICANDIMAMAVCTELENRGYLAPQDVIVTGYDNCAQGKRFYPALSSVEQNYREMGYRACDIIFSEINGNREVIRDRVRSSFSCGDSCRCKGDRDYEAMRILYCRHSFKRDTDAKILEQNERIMRQWLADLPDYKALKETLHDHYERNHQFEGDGFYIVTNRDYFRNVKMSDKDLWEKRFESGIEPLISLIDGKNVDGLDVDFVNIIPGYHKNEGEQHVYFLMPMHYLQYNYGYVILTDFPYIFEEDMLYPYMEKLQQSIRIMRTNLSLKYLYDKDQMTGLYNRFGYEDKALPLYEESIQEKSKLLVMFVDINYMKRINDKFGHLHGDNAIKTVVSAINSVFDENTIAVRFGGDEFLIIAPDQDEEKAAGAKRSILNYLDEWNSRKAFPYELTVSIGYVLTDPSIRPEDDLQYYIREADKLMYEIKKEMHAKNDRRRR